MKNKIKNILVTGGAGYIGSSLVGRLLSGGYNPVVFDNLLFGGESLLSAWFHPNFKFIKGDISDFEFVRYVFSEHSFDAVVHLAAIVGDPACAKQPELAVKINYDSTINLLNCAIKRGVKRFIFASTCSNYGKMPDSSGYVDETSPLVPVSLYAELKVKSEKVILESRKQNGEFCPTILRFATVYGVSPRMRFDLTINEFTKELVLGRELIVFGEQFWRPYCHVQDICNSILLVLEGDQKKMAGNVFNVGDTSENYQKQLIIEQIRKVIPYAKVKYVKKDEDPRDYRVSFEKIKRELGFTISKNIVDGIREVKFILDSKVLQNPDDNLYKNA